MVRRKKASILGMRGRIGGSRCRGIGGWRRGRGRCCLFLEREGLGEGAHIYVCVCISVWRIRVYPIYGRLSCCFLEEMSYHCDSVVDSRLLTLGSPCTATYLSVHLTRQNIEMNIMPEWRYTGRQCIIIIFSSNFGIGIGIGSRLIWVLCVPSCSCEWTCRDDLLLYFYFYLFMGERLGGLVRVCVSVSE